MCVDLAAAAPQRSPRQNSSLLLTDGGVTGGQLGEHFKDRQRAKGLADTASATVLFDARGYSTSLRP